MWDARVQSTRLWKFTFYITSPISFTRIIPFGVSTNMMILCAKRKHSHRFAYYNIIRIGFTRAIMLYHIKFICPESLSKQPRNDVQGWTGANLHIV